MLISPRYVTVRYASDGHFDGPHAKSFSLPVDGPTTAERLAAAFVHDPRYRVEVELIEGLALADARLAVQRFIIGGHMPEPRP